MSVPASLLVVFVQRPSLSCTASFRGSHDVVPYRGNRGNRGRKSGRKSGRKNQEERKERKERKERRKGGARGGGGGDRWTSRKRRMRE